MHGAKSALKALPTPRGGVQFGQSTQINSSSKHPTNPLEDEDDDENDVPHEHLQRVFRLFAYYSTAALNIGCHFQGTFY